MDKKTMIVLVVLCVAFIALGFALRSEVPVEGLMIDESDMLFEMFGYINGGPLRIHIVNCNLSLPLFLYAPIIRRVSTPYNTQRLIYGLEIAVGQGMILCAAYMLFGVYGLFISALTFIVSRIGLAPHIIPHGTTRLFLPIGGFLLIFAGFSHSDSVRGRHLWGCSVLTGVVIFWAMFSYPGGRPLILAAPLVWVYLLVSRKTGVWEGILSLLVCFLVAYLLGFGYASLCHDGGATFRERLRVVTNVFFFHRGWGRYVPPSRYWPNTVILYRQFFDPGQNDYAAASNMLSAVRAPALPRHVVPLVVGVLCAMLVDLSRMIRTRPVPADLRRRFLRDLFLLLFFLVGISPAIISDQPVLRRSLLGISAIVILCGRPFITARRFPVTRKACSWAVAALVLLSSVYTGGLLRGEYFKHVPYHRAGPTKRMYEVVRALRERKDIEIIFIPDGLPYLFTCFYGDPAFAKALANRVVPWERVPGYIAGAKGKTVVGIVIENKDLTDFLAEHVPPGMDGVACHIGRKIASDQSISIWNDFSVACWGEKCDLVESLLPQPQSVMPFPDEPNR